MNFLNYIKPIFHGLLKPGHIQFEMYYHDKPEYRDERHTMKIYINGGNLYKNDPKPTIFFIHGGGWAAGDKSVYGDKAKKYMLAGFNVVTVNYTYASEDPKTQWPRQLEDVITAVKKFLDLSKIFPGTFSGEIVMAGDSAGAHLAQFFGRDAKAIINMFGPCDLRTPQMQQILKDLWFLGKKPYKDNEEYYDSASPITTMDSQNICPVITVHGTKDDIVAYEQATMLKAKLDELGVQNKLITHEGGHDIYNTVPGWKKWWIDLQVLWWTLDRVHGK